MKKLRLNYVVHFHDLTQKQYEDYETGAATAKELIGEIDKLYPGFAAYLINEDETPVLQNVMVLSREGMRARAVKVYSEPICDGDYITFL